MGPPLIRDASSGFWGFPTSTMDWCEENYAVSFYIAEFWNTLSNFWFIIPPLLVTFQIKQEKLLEERFIITFMSLVAFFVYNFFVAVGVGSVAFHCTLLYHSQLLDELPMIYGTCCMFYTILQSNAPAKGPANFVLLLIFSCISIVVTLVYIVLKNPLFFLKIWWLQKTFGVGYWKICRLRGYSINNNQGWNFEGIIACTLFEFSYALGFILWNIDNEYCYTVRDLRSDLPWVLQPLLQLHAWWHFFAGIGTFLCINYSCRLRITCLGHEPRLQYLYRCIPYFDKKGKQKDANDNTQVNNLSVTKSRVNTRIGDFDCFFPKKQI